MDAIFLDKRGYADAALFTQGFSSLHPEHWRPDTDGDSALAEEIIAKERAIMSGVGNISDHIDMDAAVAWLLLCDIEGRLDAIMNEATYAFDRSAGRIVPLYTPQRNTDAWRSAGEPVANMFSALLSRADFRERMQKARTALLEKWPTAEPAELQWLANALPDAHNPARAADEVAAIPFGNTLADIAARIGGSVSGDTLSFVRGKYNIADDVITPPGTTVILGKGTRWFIAPGKRVEVNGTITMNGTDPNPVFIRPGGDGPHGGIVVNGVEGGRCVINGSRMSGGAGKDGMLVFRNTDVVLAECILNGSTTALVSVQRGAVDVSGCAFMRTEGDGLRLTNCTGKVEACNFQGSIHQARGDGLIVTAGKVDVKECGFHALGGNGLLATSGADVSATGVEVTDCGTGIAVMDGAQVRLNRASVLRCAVGLRGLRTQQHRKGGTITIAGCTFEGNRKDRELDEASRVVVESE